MYPIDEYLTELEATGIRAYRQAYHAEYMRLHKPERAGEREYLVYWSELAHRAGNTARERVLAATPTLTP